jgi:hypothetical protein
VKRWVWLVAGLLVVVGVTGLGVARLTGRKGSRPSALLTVISGWLAAWILWGFAGGLAAHYGALDKYDGTLFVILAIAGGIWQYRTHVRRGREPALAIFVGGQLLWLSVILFQNGVLSR